jgi:adenine deaminase
MIRKDFTVSGHLVDVVGKRIFKGSIKVEEGIIVSINEQDDVPDIYIMPGLIDAHIHIESSMLIPSEFARLAVVHGTVATVSDPHEIANVLGVPGVKFMIENGKKVPFRFNFGAPSCVPATSFETAGCVLGPEEVDQLLGMEEVKYLSEMMNFPGVLFDDPVVAEKLALARKHGKPVDGHAPGLIGENVAKYVGAGITTDHECFTREEALAKIACGMKILIREGSAAKNFDALCPLIDEYPDMVMLCSDDRHPEDLVEGHINLMVKKGLSLGLDRFNLLRACTLNPVRHYGLKTGLLQKGDAADFIIISDFNEFRILRTYIDGVLVADSGRTLIGSVREEPFNNFNIQAVSADEIQVKARPGKIRLIEAYDGQLITGSQEAVPKVADGFIVSDPEHDVLKLVVKNRYFEAPSAIGFIKGLGLQKGAIASCVAHDSHNIIAAGADDDSILKAINLIIREKGGIAVVGSGNEDVLALPFAGIMTVEDGYSVAEKCKKIGRLTMELGGKLKAPFMTLSFMALLVIPELKLSDKGLFNGKSFAMTDLFIK